MALAISEILKIIREDNFESRGQAVYSLIYLRGKSREVVPTLLEYLDNEDDGVRFMAAFALGVIGEETHRAWAVMDNLTHPMKNGLVYDLYSRIRHYDRVRITEDEALGGEIISGKGYGYLLVPDRETRDSSLKPISLIGPRAWNMTDTFSPVLITGVYARNAGLLVESVVPDPTPGGKTVF